YVSKYDLLTSSGQRRHSGSGRPLKQQTRTTPKSFDNHVSRLLAEFLASDMPALPCTTIHWIIEVFSVRKWTKMFACKCLARQETRPGALAFRHLIATDILVLLGTLICPRISPPCMSSRSISPNAGCSRCYRSRWVRKQK